MRACISAHPFAARAASASILTCTRLDLCVYGLVGGWVWMGQDWGYGFLVCMDWLVWMGGYMIFWG